MPCKSSLLMSGLERNQQRRPDRLADRKMDVLRHQDLAANDKAAIATERHEMKAAALLVADKLRHSG